MLLLEALIWVQAEPHTLHQGQSSDPSRAKPFNAFLMLLFSGKRATGQKSSAQQENSATENILAKWMNTDHISTTSNNDDALQGLKIPETCASAVH